MGQFTGKIELTPLDDGLNWSVDEAFRYASSEGGIVDVPAGTITDLASVPKIFWNILPPFGKYTGAAIVHDVLYHTQIFTRAKSDGILLDAMEAEGVSWWQRWTIYLGVRVGGWAAWNEHKNMPLTNIADK